MGSGGISWGYRKKMCINILLLNKIKFWKKIRTIYIFFYLKPRAIILELRHFEIPTLKGENNYHLWKKLVKVMIMTCFETFISLKLIRSQPTAFAKLTEFTVFNLHPKQKPSCSLKHETSKSFLKLHSAGMMHVIKKWGNVTYEARITWSVDLHSSSIQSMDKCSGASEKRDQLAMVNV